MKELVLLVEPAKEPSVPSPASGRGQAVAHWSAWEVPEGRISLPARLHADLLAIRAEHMAWAYDLGRLRVGRKELQEKLKAGESPSMWWCSLLYERLEPKMTPNLYTIYKLRALNASWTRKASRPWFLRRRRCPATPGGFLSGRLFVECHEPGLRLKPAQSLLRRVYNACPAPLRAAALRALVVDRAAQAALHPERKTVCRPHRAKARRHHCHLFPQPGHARRRSGALCAPATGKNCTTFLTRRPGAKARSSCAGCSSAFPRPSFPSPNAANCVTASARKAGTAFPSTIWRNFCATAILAVLWRHLRLCWASLRLEKHARPAFHFAGSRLNFWDYAKGDWAESFRGCAAWSAVCRTGASRAMRTAPGRSAGRSSRWKTAPGSAC